MKKALVVTLFMLATLAWASAQQPRERSGGQATSPGSQAPGASQSQPATPGSPDPSAPPTGIQAGSDAANPPVIEGCLGGSTPNFTITDQAGTTYKLNFPGNGDTSKLAQHVGESVRVAGKVNDTRKASNDSIDVQAIGSGTGKCSGSGSSGAQSPPKQ